MVKCESVMLEIRDISKSYNDFSLNNVSFTVEKGDYFVLLGESGAGKSMVLETIAGLVEPDSGAVVLSGKDITAEKIQDRGIGLVFQDHAIFPHLTVAENIAYSLAGKRMEAKEKNARVQTIAGELSIGELLPRKPGTLSGGELQRVALGRTLIQGPSILLLDEPLSSLDTRLKAGLRRLLRTLHRQGQTILHVTHDYEEALSLATRIAVIHEGTIIQSGSPAEVFNHPKSEFVAHFIGVKNFFPVRLAMENQACYAYTGNNTAVRIVSEEHGGEGFILVRGEDILLSVSPVETSATNSYMGTVEEIVPNSGGVEVTIDAAIVLHAVITRESFEKLGLKVGKTCWAHFKATAVRFINN